MILTTLVFRLQLELNVRSLARECLKIVDGRWAWALVTDALRNLHLISSNDEATCIRKIPWCLRRADRICLHLQTLRACFSLQT